MKINILKLIFCSIASLLFAIFFILFVFNSELESMPTYFKCYHIVYALCILVVDALFIFKTIEFSKKVYTELNSNPHKEKCAQAKAERTVAKKQAKISELESQLEELKKQ